MVIGGAGESGCRRGTSWVFEVWYRAGVVVGAATAACASPEIKLKTTQHTGSNDITTESFDAALAGLGCADRSLPYPMGVGRFVPMLNDHTLLGGDSDVLSPCLEQTGKGRH